MEDPSRFVLVEEVEFPPLAECGRRGSQRQRRNLQEFENVFLAQQRWKGKGWFEMREKDQVRENLLKEF